MNEFILFNGQLIPSASPIIPADNRGLRYGDGVFETMRLCEGKIWLASFHFERLFLGMQMLGLKKSAEMSAASLTAEILSLSKRNQIMDHARVRLMVFRGSGGLYDPDEAPANYIIEVLPIHPPANVLELQESRVDIFPDARKTTDKFSTLKTNNFLIYRMAAIFARKNTLQDAVLLNAFDRVCETTVANLFIIKDHILFTPPLQEGCIAGVMRRFLLENATAFGLKILEKPLSIDELNTAEEVFLTNSVTGIRSVDQFKARVYENHSTKQIYKALVADLYSH